MVTGAAGYIGSTLCKFLDFLKPPYQPPYVKVDIKATPGVPAVDYGDYETIRKLLVNHNIETIVHLGGLSSVPASLSYPFDYYETNVTKTQNLYEAALGTKVKNIIFASSAAVYGNNSSELFEEYTPVSPVSPYGQTKVMGEWMLEGLHKISKINYAALRLSNVAGTESQLRVGESKSSGHLCNRLAEALVNNTRFSLYGNSFGTPDGTAVRDYVHVSDVATAIIYAIDSMSSGAIKNSVMNIGSGQLYSVKEIIGVFEKRSGLKADIEFLPNRSIVDPAYLMPNVDRAKSLLHWCPHKTMDAIVDSALLWAQKKKDVDIAV